MGQVDTTMKKVDRDPVYAINKKVGRVIPWAPFKRLRFDHTDK